MAQFHSIQGGYVPQGTVAELVELWDGIDATALLQRLREYRQVGNRIRGRKGYEPEAYWRAFLALYYLNLDNVNCIVRRLEDDFELRVLCGFTTMPHRTSFNRFFSRLCQHLDLVEQASVGVVEKLRVFYPDLGQQVAIDSTTIPIHSNPNRTVVSDPEAKWGIAHDAAAKKGGKKWVFGYKSHVVADANYEIPLAQIVTTANRGDSPMLPKVMEKAEALHSWFRPKVVIADRGYDSNKNHNGLDAKGIIPIIHIREPSNTEFYDGMYTKLGVPVCLGMVPMDYVGTNPDNGFHLYKCRDEGCHLKDSKQGGILHCDSVVWEDPSTNIRLFGKIRRDSPAWKALYAKRQSIERIFKSLKQGRRLDNKHCVRGHQRIAVHAMMSTLVFQGTVLRNLRAGLTETRRWQVRRVA